MDGLFSENESFVSEIESLVSENKEFVEWFEQVVYLSN